MTYHEIYVTCQNMKCETSSQIILVLKLIFATMLIHHVTSLFGPEAFIG